MTIKTGMQAPDFTLEAQNGEMVTLSNLRRKNVVLYFYPKDMTPGCTTEACDFRDQFQNFSEINAMIIGISPDPASRHQKFIEKYGLPFTLLTDTDHQVAEAYDVWKLKKNFGKEYMGVERSTFIIDKDGKIAKEWRKVQVKGHVDDALNFIRENL
ncbi:thioredoxin-dependent thiol peroxidase [Bacillus sp. BRMEA1]|uniref:thioredoxin-dependent thiol peroxidase n=1 Tax=Neobacillus endophyticus TaxID=2738405 RepID=UPI00156594CD|nr:thioredoxin-dependent thiol peroxidase [Neobacillus endophyticus]NRD78229.1 thioredoxin-dependent thiol peroxidase [Neobacillus endophyticus]